MSGPKDIQPFAFARPQQVQPHQMLANGQIVRTSAGGTQGNMGHPIIRPGMSMVNSFIFQMLLQFT